MQAFASAFEDSHRTPPGSRVTGFFVGKTITRQEALVAFPETDGLGDRANTLCFLARSQELSFPRLTY